MAEKGHGRLLDAIAAELSANGLNIVARDAVASKVREQGRQLSHILNKEEYPQLAELANLKTIVVINTLPGPGMIDATCEVISLQSGEERIATARFEQSKQDHSKHLF